MSASPVELLSASPVHELLSAECLWALPATITVGLGLFIVDDLFHTKLLCLVCRLPLEKKSGVYQHMLTWLGRLSRSRKRVSTLCCDGDWAIEKRVTVGTSAPWRADQVQWTLANPNSLGPEPIQISEIFGLVKATAATCVIVTAPYLHSVLGSLASLPLLHVHRTHNTAPKLSFSTLLLHLTRKT